MYILEGNIGSGKSTLLELIQQQKCAISVVSEPVGSWTRETYGASFLAKFYENPTRWAYTMETFAMAARAKDHRREQQNPYPHRILERSIYSGHYCFAQNGRQLGYFTDLEWELYQAWANFFLKKSCQPPHGFIYLRVSPEVCFKRMEQRSRKSESSLSFDYMKHIHDWHEKFLIKKEGIAHEIAAIPTLILDGDEDFVENPQIFAQHLEKIISFMDTTFQRKTFDFSPVFI